MSLDTPTREARLDRLFAYPERSSFTCPRTARARLVGFLDTAPEQVFQAEGLIGWLGMNEVAGWINYLAESEAVLEAHGEAMLSHFKAVALRHDRTVIEAFLISDTGRRIFEEAGFVTQHQVSRMQTTELRHIPPDPRIRRAEERDVEPIVAIMRATFPDTSNDTELLRGTIRANAHPHVIELDGVVAGYILIVETDYRLTISGLGVLPAYQGHRLGKALVGYAVELAHQKGKEAVDVMADHKPEVVAFYQRCGFQSFHPAYMLVASLAAR